MKNMHYNKTHYIMDLPKQSEFIKMIHLELLNAGGKAFTREEILSMSVEELLFICTRNNIDFNMKYIGKNK